MQASNTHDRILVTGAAGGVGANAREAARILIEQGRAVRALVHRDDERAAALRAMGAEVVVADLLDLAAVHAAMAGCGLVYFTMSIAPGYLEAAANMAVTAKSLNVRAFVNLSQMTLSQMNETASTDSPQQRQHWLAEQMLRWSGLPVVYLRPTAFYDGMFLVQGARGIRDDNAIRLPFADGKTSPIAGSDVGAAAAAVLADPAPYIGQVLELTGPASLNMHEIAAVFSRELGRTIEYIDVPPAVWEAKLKEMQLPPHLLAHLATMGALHRANRYDRMTDTFARVVGRPPVDLSTFIRRNIGAFKPT